LVGPITIISLKDATKYKELLAYFFPNTNIQKIKRIQTLPSTYISSTACLSCAAAKSGANENADEVQGAEIS
jgi:hypothetical protein